MSARRGTSVYLSRQRSLLFDVTAVQSSTSPKVLGSLERTNTEARAGTGRSYRGRARAGVLLDRDGTIIVDHGYVGSVERVELIDGAGGAVAAFNRAGVPVAVITNQSGVARGLYGTRDVELVHDHIAAELAEYEAHIDLFLYCPYHPEGIVHEYTRVSDSRKPGAGMARAAAGALNLDLGSCWVVGDSIADIGMARAIGASAVYVGQGTWAEAGVWSFPDLAASAPFILERIAS